METNLKKTILISIAALGLVACRGGGTAGSTDLSSRATGSDMTDTTKAWVQCNTGNSRGGTFGVRLAAVVENGNLRNDLMYVRIGSVPSGFAASSSYFQLFRWQANTAGSTYLDPTPLNFEIWYNNSLVLAARSSLRWSDVQAVATQLGQSDPGSFLRGAILKVDLRDPTAQFDVLMTVLYSSSNTELDRSNALLPVFAANPEVYATDTDGLPRNQILMDLHPFKSSVGQGWTTADYQSRANTFCSSF